MEGTVFLHSSGVAIANQPHQTWEVVHAECEFPLTISSPLEVEESKELIVGKEDVKRSKKSNRTGKKSEIIRQLGPDCHCPTNCFKKIGKDTIWKIFQDFWALADYNSQNAYLFGLINLIGVKRRYTKNETSRRNFTVVYNIKCEGRNVPVCKKAFLNIHGLQKNRGRINNLANKIKEGKSVPPPDKRGRHKNRPNAYSEDDVEHVRRHLALCPKIDRRKTMVLSTKRCYSLYVDEYCKNNEVTPVSLDKFRRVFAKEGYKNGRRGVRKSGKGSDQ